MMTDCCPILSSIIFEVCIMSCSIFVCSIFRNSTIFFLPYTPPPGYIHQIKTMFFIVHFTNFYFYYKIFKSLAMLIYFQVISEPGGIWRPPGRWAANEEPRPGWRRSGWTLPHRPPPPGQPLLTPTVGAVPPGSHAVQSTGEELYYRRFTRYVTVCYMDWQGGEIIVPMRAWWTWLR